MSQEPTGKDDLGAYAEHDKLGPLGGKASVFDGEGDLRAAFYGAYTEEDCEYLKLDGTVTRALDEGREVVAATFITPYPPGFPVLVPGQVISREILEYLRALDVKEIHGYDPVHGLRVFTEDALARMAEAVARRKVALIEAGTAAPHA